MRVHLLAEIVVDTDLVSPEVKDILETAYKSTSRPMMPIEDQGDFLKVLGQNITSCKMDYRSGRMQ